MTPEDRALNAMQKARNWLAARELLPHITQAIRDAVREERDECAALIESLLSGDQANDLACWALAKAIRARR